MYSNCYTINISMLSMLSMPGVGLNYHIHIIPVNNSSALMHTHTHTVASNPSQGQLSSEVIVHWELGS